MNKPMYLSVVSMLLMGTITCYLGKQFGLVAAIPVGGITTGAALFAIKEAMQEVSERKASAGKRGAGAERFLSKKDFSPKL